MSDKPVSLTVRDLDDHLRDLVKWKRFALNLPGIDQSDIEVIVTEKRDDVAEQKLLLFDKWLSVYPKATWQDVTQALEKADKFTIANKLGMKLLPPAISSPVSPQQTVDNTTKEEVEVTKDTAEKLDMLNKSFITFTIKSKAAIENGECSLSEVVTYVKHSGAYKILGVTEVRNVAEFFDVIEPHYTFLDCYLLVNLALSLLPSVKQSAQQYVCEVEEFKNGTKVRSLHKILTRFFNKVKFENNVEVTIKVQNVWGKCNMWLVEVLVQTLFCLNSPDECKWFRVLPGSLCVVFMVHEDMLITLMNKCEQKIQFMKLMGVISLDTRNSFLPVSEDNVEYTFEQSLIEATKAGNTEAVKFLVKQLHVDANTKSIEEPTASLKEEADEWYEKDDGNFYFKHDAGCTALMIACCNNDTDIVKLLLENSADPNIQSNLGFTALIYASCIGGIDCVRMLLDHNADINLKKYSSGSSALFFASYAGNLKLVKILLKQKDVNSNIQRKDGATPLYIASQNGHLEIVKRLLKKKVNPNTPCNGGVTPLFIASQNGHLEIVERLLKKKVYPNTPCDDGATPLFIASQNGHLKIVERLLKKKIYPNTPCDDGATPLFIASQNGHLEIVERLLKEKFNPNTPRDDGATPLYIAKLNGHLEIVERLLGEEVNLNTQHKKLVPHLSSLQARRNYEKTPQGKSQRLPMSDKPVSLTVRDLDDHLRDLVKWKRFALYLPGIDQSDIEVIVKEKRDDVAEQKLLLFSKWLSVHPKATWEDVTHALEKADEFTIANKLKMKLLPSAISSPVSLQQTIDKTTKKEVEITKDIVEELDRLNTTFETLTIKSLKAIEEGESSLSEVSTHVKGSIVCEIFGVSEVKNVAEFFDVIKPHYTFLNCYLLVDLALSLLPSVKHSAQEYIRKVDEFMKSTKVISLHKTLNRFFLQANLENNFEVIIRLQNLWGVYNMWLVEVLVQTLFCLDSPDKCKWFRVLPG